MVEPVILRVLAVDDDERVSRSIKRMLRGRFDVVVVTTVAAAIEQLVEADLNQSRFDLVLCDVHVAEASYVDVLSVVRRCRDPSAFILISGADEPTCSGADAFLAKPFTTSDFVETTAAMLFARSQPTTRPVPSSKHAEKDMLEDRVCRLEARVAKLG